MLPAEYMELKEFFRFFSDRFLGFLKLEPEQTPLAILEANEGKSPARAASGLRMAINDCIEMSSRMPSDQVSSLDAELRSKGLLTLSQVRQRYWARKVHDHR